ncbi:MAG TPA: L-seryl-tRNA(Sec) selenium transferase, partial [Quisquiliibacterium sp.]|nr:L-seryl-tRNA(Sec) selenium transferase [Quisquiliibacterium sp.]
MARHDAPAAGDPMARPQDLPSVDRLLRLPAVQTMVADHGHTLVAGECRALLDTLRGRALAGALPMADADPRALEAEVRARIDARLAPR